MSLNFRLAYRIQIGLIFIFSAYKLISHFTSSLALPLRFAKDFIWSAPRGGFVQLWNMFSFLGLASAVILTNFSKNCINCPSW